MNIRLSKKSVLVSLTVLLVFCLCGFIGLRYLIQSSLDDLCATAQAAHPHSGNSVASLIDYVESESHTLSQRNSAVWALGQLRNPKALPALEKAYTGNPSDHKTALCQYELEKAIRLCKGETPNILCIRTTK